MSLAVAVAVDERSALARYFQPAGNADGVAVLGIHAPKGWWLLFGRAALFAHLIRSGPCLLRRISSASKRSVNVQVDWPPTTISFRGSF
jgi:hypothetical protein